MSYSGTPTLYGERQIAAAYQSGTRLPVVSIAVGDGNGAAVTPTEGMTALVNEVYRAPITSWGVDPADPRRIVVRTTIPPTAGPFTVREAGVFDSNGGMIAVTALAATEIVAPGTANQATSIDLIVALPVGSAGAITVSPTLGERFTIERLFRTPFISINSATVATPPASPAVGDLYIVPANPGGAWATAPVGDIAEWNGIFWAFLQPPLKMVAGIMDAPEDGTSEFLKWNGAGWEPFAADGCIFTVVDAANASTSDDLVGTAAPGLTALQPNMVFHWRQGATANLTASPKGNVDGFGDVPFTKADASALAKGDLPAGADFLSLYDPTGPRHRVFGARPSDTAKAATTIATTVVQTVGIVPATGVTMVYVDSTSGSDATGTGSQAAPYKTNLAAYNAANTGHVAYGSYGVILQMLNPAKPYDLPPSLAAIPNLTILGDRANPGNYILIGAAPAGSVACCGISGCTVLLDGLSVSNATPSKHTLAAVAGGNLNLGNVNLTSTAAIAGAHLLSGQNGGVGINGALGVQQSAAQLLYVSGGNAAIFGTVTPPANGTFTDAVIAVEHGYAAVANGPSSFSGSTSGRKFRAVNQAEINTYGSQGANIPGSSAGYFDATSTVP